MTDSSHTAKRILVIGATSAIAEACSRRWAERGAHLYLVGRDAERLGALVADLRTRGAAAAAYGMLDVNDFDRHAQALDQALAELGRLDVALVAHGTLGDQRQAELSVEETLAQIRTNGLSVVALLTDLANRMQAQGAGTIAVIGSVAGDRGRQSNYVYGTAKAMVATFLQGLRNRLHPHGVRVLTIKPGFVDTPMTAHLPKGPLWASPQVVAQDILRAIDRGRDVLYTPVFWRWIMTVIRMIPERVFKRMRL